MLIYYTPNVPWSTLTSSGHRPAGASALARVAQQAPHAPFEVGGRQISQPLEGLRARERSTAPSQAPWPEISMSQSAWLRAPPGKSGPAAHGCAIARRRCSQVRSARTPPNGRLRVRPEARPSRDVRGPRLRGLTGRIGRREGQARTGSARSATCAVGRAERGADEPGHDWYLMAGLRRRAGSSRS